MLQNAINSIARDYPGCEVRPFSAFLPLSKAATDDAGFRHVYGPVAAEGEDLDGETADQGHLWKGLQVHRNDYGGWVDYNHLYPATGKEEYLIGRGEPLKVDGRPWLDTRLIKGNSHADKVFDWADQGMHVGYSVYGMGVRDGKIYKATCIQFVTCAPMPKGKTDLFLQTSAPAGSLVSVSKALSHDVPLVGTAEEWLGVEQFAVAMDSAWAAVRKAFTTGSGVVSEGATGGQALRTQYLAGGGTLQSATFAADDEDDSDDADDKKKKKRKDEQDERVTKALRDGFYASGHIRHPEALAARLVESGALTLRLPKGF